MQRAARMGKGSLSKHGKLLLAQSMYDKGKSFIGAAILLRQKGGSEYVVLHLLCQGIEVVLKAFLLFQDYDRYKPQLKKLGHNLVITTETVLKACQLKKPLPDAVRTELQLLNSFYTRHLLRYGSFADMFVRASTISSDRVCRKILAAIRLANQRMIRNAPSNKP